MRSEKFRWLSRLGAMFAGLMMLFDSARAGEVVGWMDVRPSNGMIEIAGRAYSAAPMTVDYTLKIDRAGPSGSAVSSQRGRADIEAGQIARLSTTSVNFGATDELTVTLTLSSNGQTLATSEIHIGRE